MDRDKYTTSGVSADINSRKYTSRSNKELKKEKR
jgi:hypothetical protein